MSFAEGTKVSVEKSRAEIESLLRKYGADQFASGWSEASARIMFRAKDRHVRFLLPFPSRTDKNITHKKDRSGYVVQRSDIQKEEAYQQELRRRWRALALVVKAKLEAVETGITTFEEEFMAHIVMPDGQTVAEHAMPMIAAAYQSGKVQALLPGW